MAFLKYAHANIVRPSITMAGWDEIRAKASVLGSGLAFGQRSAQVVLQKFQPDQYLLSHCTIIASVDTEQTNSSLGGQLVDGFQIDRRYDDYLVTPETTKYINNNQDCWERKLLLASFRTFIGGENYVEHLQIPELSKGKIVDAAARDIGDSIYVDILVATDLKHRPLITAVQSGHLQTLSMGCSVQFTICTKCGNVAEDETQLCFPPGTRVLRSDGTYIPIEDVVEGDLLVSHKGRPQSVSRVGSRFYQGFLNTLKVEGVPSTLRSTPDHPYWVMRPAAVCACGCGKSLHRTVEHERGSWKAFRRRFLPGHNSNVVSLKDRFETKLEFVEAQEIRVGDYLTFPIPQETVLTDDGIPGKAKLIGYFCAEGSFIKQDGKLVGVSFDFGSHERGTLVEEVCSLLSQTFGKACRKSGHFWRDLIQKTPVKPVARRATSRFVPKDVACPSCHAPSEYAYNARFKTGRDDCYRCKICGRCWVQGACHEVTPRVYDNGSSCSVRLMDGQAAEFFFRHCGEYASAKRLSPEVMAWPADIQRYVLNGWLGGDGTQNADGVRGNTASFHLSCQMHFLAARCEMYVRRGLVFGGRSAEIRDVVNGDGSVTTRDSRGWLPSFSVMCPEPTGFSGELRFDDREQARVTMAPLTNGFKRVGNWLLYRVRSVGVEAYSGPVHNVEVAEDHSYVVEGVAVHNCPHIRYQKGNTYTDELGKQRKIAELCGHVTAEPGSVKFIEASWVANPAFTGAVLRSILTPEQAASLGKRVQVAFSQAPRVADPGAMQRAARMKAAQFDFGDSGGGGDEGDGGDKKDEDPLEKAVGEMADFIRERAIKKVREEMGEHEIPRADLNENQNNSLIKEASSDPRWQAVSRVVQAKVGKAQASRMLFGLLLYRHGGWSAIQASNKFKGAGVLALSRLLDLFDETPRVAGEGRLYRTVLAVGGIAAYSDVESYLVACRRVIGRQLTGSEKDTLVVKGRLYDLGAS
jgi:hypothetical protein